MLRYIAQSICIRPVVVPSLNRALASFIEFGGKFLQVKAKARPRQIQLK